MNKIAIFSAVILMLIIFSCGHSDEPGSEIVLARSQVQLRNMLNYLGDTNLNPRCTNEDGTIRLVESSDWTSGFFPGCLWMQYEYSQDEFWKRAAQHYTHNVEDQQFNGTTHDMGFKMFCSYGNGYRLTNDPEYKKILIQSANTLSTRFNPIVGCLRSWDHHAEQWQFPVIIDNMMNLELLFWASKITHDSSYYNIAVSHANTTLKNHFRDDFSSYHVIGYDSLTGEVLQKQTHQGFANESAWSRGQGWGLYGYTLCFRETGDRRYLVQAINIANFIMANKNLPSDGVPYWDFNDPNIPDVPRDASAAAVICSALYEMSSYMGDEGLRYKQFANKIFVSLSSPEYLAHSGDNNNFILKHSTGNMPVQDEVDKPIIYADYYFMEAALRKLALDNASSFDEQQLVALLLDKPKN